MFIFWRGKAFVFESKCLKNADDFEFLSFQNNGQLKFKSVQTTSKSSQNSNLK